MTTGDLIRYNHAVRDVYLKAFSELPWEEVVKPRGLSFDSARNVFLHLTFAEDRWVNYILQNRFREWKDRDFNKYEDIESLKQLAEIVKKSTETYLQSMKPEDWNRKVTVPFPNYPPNTQVTVETALTHVVIEDVLHYGELSAALWQMDLEAPYLAYLRFKLAQGQV